MMLFRIRLLVLGLLSVMAIGTIASTAATASPGPFWWIRAHEKEVGKKLAENTVEQGKASSAGVVYSTMISGVPAEFEVQIQGKYGVWNAPNQGQMKLQISLSNFHGIGALKKECTATVAVPEDYVGHLMWKYRGIAKELSQEGTQESNGQEWDMAIAPARSILGEKGFEHQGEEPILAKLSFANKSECGVLAGAGTNLIGVTGFQDQQLKIGVFAKKMTVIFPGHEIWQHYWNGKAVETLKGELFSKVGPAAASFNGSLSLEFEKQEVDVHE